jgi:plastocyanin
MRRVLVLAAVLTAILPLGARADVPPYPDPNFAHTIIPRPCNVSDAPDGSGTINTYEQKQFADEGWAPVDDRADHATDYIRYGAACQRLQFRFGPIHVKPGQNDVLIQPVTIEKPAYDGYLVRFSPNLIEATDGSVPPIEKIHLHHGTWITLTDYTGGFNSPVYDGRTYGSGPFFASGEEKTIADFPRGFGMPIKATDQWQLLYMVHNITARPDEVYITYDIDYIARADGDALGIKPIYPLWLDVLRGSGYPVFNVQRGFGTDGVCTWPRFNCARFDSYGKTTVNQGAPLVTKPDATEEEWRAAEAEAEAAGTLKNLLTLPKQDANGNYGRLGRIDHFYGGTLIGIGGHLHPGGLTDDIELVRKIGSTPVSKTVFVSDAKYWDWNNPSAATGPANSWDLSMTVTGLPRWALHVNPGDSFRIEGTYDTTLQSTYENMGITVGYITPDPAPGQWSVPNAIDVFDTATYPGGVDATDDCASGGLAGSPKTLCLKGVVTHGHMAEANNHGGAASHALGGMGVHTDSVAIANFLYLPGDQGRTSGEGIPRVSLGQTLTFTNFDAFADIYHTVTSCAAPCNGQVGIAYPLSNGLGTIGSVAADFDSSELGYGLNQFGPAKNEIEWGLDITGVNGFTSGELYTYFCRVHPTMQGVFAVE